MEYGAMLTASKVVYMHGSLAAVTAFIAEYSDASPLQLVERNITGAYPGYWQ